MPLIKISNLYLNLSCPIISLDKDERILVAIYSTLANLESSITDKHSPLINASPQIKSCFDILSNEIMQMDLPNWTGPFT